MMRVNLIRCAILPCLFAAGIIVSVSLAGCSRQDDAPLDRAGKPKPEAPPAYFMQRPSDPRAIPSVTVIPVPEELGGNAIWGSTGRDSRGHIWFGLSMAATPGANARLLEYDPQKNRFHHRGDVLGALKESGLLRDGESQSKIHSRIVQAADGNLYFASTDEAGADYIKGTRPPRWGGHLWRLRLPENKWEHLATTTDGLIAVSAAGGKVYALGFFGHILHQYDCKTGALRSVEVGSVDGHISRNFVTDYRGHAYVPRVRRDAGTGDILATLVEYDDQLKELHETPLAHYTGDDPTASHGITAFQPMADFSVIFVTAAGYMYRVIPPKVGYARVEEVGWLHPEKRRYVASLFTYAGKSYVMGLATKSKDIGPGKRYEWVVYHAGVRHIKAIGGVPLDFAVTGKDAPNLAECLLYGSVTRDNDGNFYVVGAWHPKNRPLILKVHCPQ